MLALTVAERKHRLPYGAQKKIARRLGVARSYVSAAVAGDCRPKTKRAKLRLRRVQVAIAGELGLPVEEAFDAQELAYAVQPSQFARAS